MQKKKTCQKSYGQISNNLEPLGDPLPKLFKVFCLVEKHGRQRAWSVFPMLIQGILSEMEMFVRKTTLAVGVV